MVAAAGLCSLLLCAAEQSLSSIVNQLKVRRSACFLSLEEIESILTSPFDLSSISRDRLSLHAVEPTLYDVQVLPKLTLLLNTLPALWNVLEFESSSQISEFNQANTPASWEHFDHNRPPNWEYFQRSRRFLTNKFVKLFARRVSGAGEESKVICVRRRRRRLHSLLASEEPAPTGAVRFSTRRGFVVVIRLLFLSLPLS